jgi:phosphate transport system substrate-binding protein
VKVDGSSTVLRVSEAVLEAYRNANPGVRVTLNRAGTGGGFKKFSNGEIDICNASRPITEIERQMCEKKGVEFIELEIARDGLSVVVNPKNDWCDCLTVEQLKAIWQPGSTVSKWSDIKPEWPAEEIHLYGPGTDSGTFDFFTEAIVGDAGKSRADYMPSEDDNSLVTGVAGDTYGLGYFGLAYYEENEHRLKVLGIDPGDGECVKPSQETVRDKSYQPLSRPLFIYVNTAALARSDVRSFVEYYVAHVDELVTKAGYVPLPEDVAAKTKEALDAALAAIPSKNPDGARL